jgi:hypothetical protein
MRTLHPNSVEVNLTIGDFSSDLIRRPTGIRRRLDFAFDYNSSREDSMGTRMPVRDLVSDAFGEAFATINRCVQLFVDAKLEERIYFDHDVLTAGLQTMSELIARAAKLDPERRVKYLQHWAEHGPQLCQETISVIERRSPPVMHPQDVKKFLQTPDYY